MDGLRFDVWTRRRVSLATGTLLAGLAGLVPLPGKARKRKRKKKKTCKKPRVKCEKKCCKAGHVCSSGACALPEECQFAKTATVWTLQSNCTITRTLDIPFGVSLDGNGKTISLSGPNDAFLGGAGVRGGRGDTNVDDLTVDGRGLTGSCESEGIVLLFWDGSQIDNVEARNNRCGSGINGRAINRATVSGMRDHGIVGGIVGPLSSVTNSIVRDCGWGLVDFAGDAQIAGNTLENVRTGIWIAARTPGAHATVQNNTLRNTPIGIISIGSMDATGNTLIGPGPESNSRSAGIYFDEDSSGSASGNTISNFRDDHPSQVSCAIVISPDAGAVTIGENTFPDPPGNDEDVCTGF